MKKEFDDFTVEYDDSQETKDKAFDKLMEYYIKHEAFDGETIMQSDQCIIEAPEILYEIAENIIGFKINWR